MSVLTLLANLDLGLVFSATSGTAVHYSIKRNKGMTYYWTGISCLIILAVLGFDWL